MRRRLRGHGRIVALVLAALAGGALLAPGVGSAARQFQQVLVANDERSPVPTRHVGGPLTVTQQEPERFTQSGRVENINGLPAQVTVAVPDGKDLVVTAISGLTADHPTATVRPLRATSDQGGAVFLAWQRDAPAGSDHPAVWSVHEQVDLLVSNELTLRLNAYDVGQLTPIAANWEVQGYLVQEAD